LLVLALTNKDPFCILFSAMFFEFLRLLLAILLCKMASELSAKVLSSVPKLKKTEMCLREKIRALDKLRLGPS